MVSHGVMRIWFRYAAVTTQAFIDQRTISINLTGVCHAGSLEKLSFFQSMADIQYVSLIDCHCNVSCPIKIMVVMARIKSLLAQLYPSCGLPPARRRAIISNEVSLCGVSFCDNQQCEGHSSAIQSYGKSRHCAPRNLEGTFCVTLFAWLPSLLPPELPLLSFIPARSTRSSLYFLHRL